MQADNLSKFKDKGRTGLSNVGNTCYMNSCLQCLSHTYELNNFLDSKTYKERLTNTPESVIFVEWDNLRTLMWSQNCTIAPYGFVNAIKKVAGIKKYQLFTTHEQNDLQEFLMFLLECFHKAVSREVDMKVTGIVKSKVDIMAAECFEMMRSMHEKDYSEIISMFYGVHVSTITSPENSEILSVRPEPFSVLSLSLPAENDITLYSCIDEFCKKDRLDGDNSWFNEKTNQKQDVDKGIVFWNFPEILIIHLKRWNYDGNKDNRLVNIPLENLDLTRYVKGYNKMSFVYHLYGVCNHHGGVTGGHYTSSVKTIEDKWYTFNDTNVTNINSNAVISVNAYCLFFRKKNSK